MIHMTSTKELAQEVVHGTAYENSVIPTDELQGCETYVGDILGDGQQQLKPGAQDVFQSPVQVDPCDNP